MFDWLWGRTQDATDSTRESDEAFESMRLEFAKLCALYVLDDEKETRHAEALREFEVLAGHKDVADIGVVVSKQRLVVGLKTLRLRDSAGVLRHIGEMLIHIEGKIILFDNPTPLEDFKHPHVNKEGKLCMFTGHSELMALLAEGRLAEAVFFVMDALKVTDSGLPYRSLEHWPAVKEEA